MNAYESFPAHRIWRGLLEGDPAPAVAFFDSLLEADLAFAAGGFLRDIAERITDARQHVEDEVEQQRFVATAKEAIVCCLQGDPVSVDQLLAECTDTT